MGGKKSLSDCGVKWVKKFFAKIVLAQTFTFSTLYAICSVRLFAMSRLTKALCKRDLNVNKHECGAPTLQYVNHFGWKMYFMAILAPNLIAS